MSGAPVDNVAEPDARAAPVAATVHWAISEAMAWVIADVDAAIAALGALPEVIAEVPPVTAWDAPAKDEREATSPAADGLAALTAAMVLAESKSPAPPGTADPAPVIAAALVPAITAPALEVTAAAAPLTLPWARRSPDDPVAAEPDAVMTAPGTVAVTDAELEVTAEPVAEIVDPDTNAPVGVGWAGVTPETLAPFEILAVENVVAELPPEIAAPDALGAQ